MNVQASECSKCDGCQHQKNNESTDWCFMFENAPSKLPCAQHDKFSAERELMGKVILANPSLLQIMVRNAQKGL
jgi:hypothetical protein